MRGVGALVKTEEMIRCIGFALHPVAGKGWRRGVDIEENT